jgi:glycosyltransferase
MKISIVTAVYNREATIADALNSVHHQTYPHVQHIVQDGGSTDATLDIVRAHKNDRIDLVSGRDSGIYDAINRGMQRAQGDVVGLMHSDDIFAHETVLAQIAHAFEDPQVDCVYGDLQYVASGDTNRVIRHWKSGDYSREILKRGWMPPHPTFYLRRAILERLGDYDTSYQIAADYDAMLRWLWTGGTARVTVDDTVSLITENQSVYIPLGTVHRMENPGKVPMVLIEVQTGSYLGEDDIIRYEDVYARGQGAKG